MSNEAIVIVPKRLRGQKSHGGQRLAESARPYPALGEERKLRGIGGGGVDFVPHPEIWIFASPTLGASQWLFAMISWTLIASLCIETRYRLYLS